MLCLNTLDRFGDIWGFCFVLDSSNSKCILYLSSAIYCCFDPEVAYYVILHLVC